MRAASEEANVQANAIGQCYVQREGRPNSFTQLKNIQAGCRNKDHG